jgi:hypothetical protein
MKKSASAQLRNVIAGLKRVSTLRALMIFEIRAGFIAEALRCFENKIMMHDLRRIFITSREVYVMTL